MSLFFLLILLSGTGVVLLILMIIGLASKKRQLTQIAAFLLIACVLGGVWTGIELTRKVVTFAENVVDNTNQWLEEELTFESLAEEEIFLRNSCSKHLAQLDSTLNTDTLVLLSGRAFGKIFPLRGALYYHFEASEAFIDNMIDDMEAVSFADVSELLTPEARHLDRLKFWNLERIEQLDIYRAKVEDADAENVAIFAAIDRDSGTVYFHLNIQP